MHSLLSSLKDLVDCISEIDFLPSKSISQISHQVLFNTICPNLFSSIKFIFLYVFSFQWVQEFSTLPIIVPRLYGRVFLEQFAKTDNFLFSFLQPAVYDNNKFLVGFLNSFFLTLPISVINLVNLRRLLVQGIPAGIASALGGILGHWLFTTCVVFGLRFIIYPWFSFDPLIYVIGLYLVVKIVYDMAAQRSMALIKSSQKGVLIRICFLTFALSWTEQSCIFQHLNSLTFTPQPSFLENLNYNSFFSHLNYSLGILLGSLFFTIVFGYLSIRLSTWIPKRFGMLTSRWVNRLNRWLMRIILAFAITTVPYYGLDYLFTKPLGFLSQDKLSRNHKILSPTIESYRPSGEENKDNWLELPPLVQSPLTPFDRSRFIFSPYEIATFEELHYQGDYAWNQRESRSSSYYRKVKVPFTVSSVFNKLDRLLRSRRVDLQEEKKKLQSGITESEPVKKKREVSVLDQLKPLGLDLYPSGVGFYQEEGLTERTYRYKRFKNPFRTLKIRQDLDQFNTAAEEEILNPVASTVRFQNTKYDTDLTHEGSTKLKFARIYYTNPIFKFLLNVDIDGFIKRQPKNFTLSPEEEKDLFVKRLKLKDYYYSTYAYNRLKHLTTYRRFFGISKSYANSIYDQQFQGTLKHVRRLFAVNFNYSKGSPRQKLFHMIPETGLLNQQRVLKFDQPLYDDQIQGKPLVKQVDTEKDDFSDTEDDSSLLREVPTTEIFIFHEELRAPKEEINPILEKTVTRPLYAGWDESQRKLVLTNKVYPKRLTSKFFTKDDPRLRDQLLAEGKGKKGNVRIIKGKVRYYFTDWPFNKGTVKNILMFDTEPDSAFVGSKINKFFNWFDVKEKKAHNYQFFFESRRHTNKDNDDATKELFWAQRLNLGSKLESFPSHIKLLEHFGHYQSPPNRGGSFWPGAID